MQPVAELMDTVLKALGELSSTSRVVADPITVEGYTIIPLCKVSIGFAGGGGGGNGKHDKDGNEAQGSGTGGGVRVEPVAVLSINKEGVSLLTVGGRSGILAQALEAVPDVVDKIKEARGNSKED